SRRRHTRFSRDWSSDVCSSDLLRHVAVILRNIADTHRGINDDGPDGGNKNYENRRRRTGLKSSQGNGQPGQWWYGTQHLKNRVEAAHGPFGTAHQYA